MKKTYSVTLKGTSGGTLNFVDVKLGGQSLLLDSDDSVTWTNDGIEIDFQPPLTIHLEVGALKGTKWDIAVTEENAAAACFKASGKTGDQTVDGDPNTSMRDGNTSCQ